MSRERPTEPPRAVPDAERGKTRRETPAQIRQREHIEALMRAKGPGLLAAIFNPYMRAGMPAPQFIRPSYERAIAEKLKAFYAARPRPWRPAAARSCRQTRKEQLNASRGGRHAGSMAQ